MEVLMSRHHRLGGASLAYAESQRDSPAAERGADPEPGQLADPRRSKIDGTSLRFIRFDAVKERTGLSRSTIWRLERRGDFPRHRRISANAVAWIEEEVSDSI